MWRPRVAAAPQPQPPSLGVAAQRPRPQPLVPVHDVGSATACIVDVIAHQYFWSSQLGLWPDPPIADSRFRRGPLRTLGDVEYITADYVAWYNQQRLMHRLGRIPPAEAEAQYYSQPVTDRPAGSQNPRGP
jgi:putative transposase